MCLSSVCARISLFVFFVGSFFFQAEDGIRDGRVTGVQTCALPISDDVWPALSLAVTSSAWLPSPGIVQLTLYGPGEATVPSEFHEPVEQSVLVLEHSKNCTLATPLPASVAPAVNGLGLENEPLTEVGGAVIETVGATLSTR